MYSLNSLQNFYGLAIRQNQMNLNYMERAIGAILYHCSGNGDKEIRHQFYPKTKDSWCKFQLERLNNTSNHKDRISLPRSIKHVLEPIFRDLSSDSLHPNVCMARHKTPMKPVASWEHSFWGGQRLEFSDNETIFPTKTLPFPDLIFMTQYDRELKTNNEKNLID